jgi:hypothetical protein
VLLHYRLAHFLAPLRELVDDPEMRALLAASPQAGRLLRPLWRKLTPDPLPEVLRLPPKPPRPARPRLALPERARPPESPSAALARPHPAAAAGLPLLLPSWPPPQTPPSRETRRRRFRGAWDGVAWSAGLRLPPFA